MEKLSAVLGLNMSPILVDNKVISRDAHNYIVKFTVNTN